MSRRVEGYGADGIDARRGGIGECTAMTLTRSLCDELLRLARDDARIEAGPLRGLADEQPPVTTIVREMRGDAHGCRATPYVGDRPETQRRTVHETRIEPYRPVIGENRADTGIEGRRCLHVPDGGESGRTRADRELGDAAKQRVRDGVTIQRLVFPCGRRTGAAVDDENRLDKRAQDPVAVALRERTRRARTASASSSKIGTVVSQEMQASVMLCP
jgi:hypothetical protein